MGIGGLNERSRKATDKGDIEMLNNGWKGSVPLLQTKIQYQCKHCELWMGEQHDYTECYKGKLKMICSNDLNKKHPMDMLLYQKFSKEFNGSLRGDL